MSALPLRPEDRPEIEKAVAIAALTTLASELVKWMVEEAKDAVKKRREAPKS